MNKIAKRLVAGASAAALLVSAVGVDQLADLFTKTSYAEYSSKTAKSTGFPNLEQDTTTDNKAYNTGYGLHTNKTATEVGSDGRTFDVNLESWYVGENPVDVATILDASGSMAWTVDTLKPLNVSAQLTADDKSYLSTKYGTDVLSEIQEEHDGYLPQDVVDLILDKTKTDNTKLKYAGYKYYVYEDRSSVSEFVPLGYWDGGDPAEKFEPIGYYPFNGTLDNKAKEGATAKLIKHAADTSGTFDKDSVPTDTIEPTYVKKSDGSFDSTLDIDETAENGALLADVQVTGSFTVAMRVKADQILSNGAGVDNTPLIYIGNGKDNYISVYRNGSGSDPRRLKIDVNGHNVENIGNIFQKTSTDGNNLGSDNWINIALTYNESTKKVSIDLSVNGKAKVDGADTVSNHFDIDVSTYSLNFDKADIIIGGDVVNDTHVNPYTNTQLTAFCVFNHALTEDTDIKNVISDNIKTHSKLPEGLAGYYDFGDEDSVNRLGNRVAADGSLSFIEQAEDKTFSKTEIKPGEANPKYSSDSYSGSRALNISQTAKLGAVLLDTAPSDSTFTLSFAVKKASNDNDSYTLSTTDPASFLYIGSMDTTNDYYQIMRRESGTSKSRLVMREKNKNTNHVNINKVFDDKTDYSVITIVVNGTKVTQYKDGNVDSASNDLSEEITADDLALIIGGLWNDDYNGSDILIDDLYVFDKALDADQVAAVAKAEEGQTEFAKVPDKLTDGCEGYHATMKGKDVDIAQIKETLAQNPNDDEREGWYYVNSHSTWADVEDCLASGKQYIGIYDKASSSENKDGIENVDNAGKDIATIPSAYNDTTNAEYKAIKESIEAGDNDVKKFDKAPENERSIRFYVDSQNHLRCFAWSGSTSKDTDIRTFCSLVYEKQDDQITKYEELNNALNTFYQKIAEKSDLSNNAVVRFSTNSAVDQTVPETTDTNLKKLIMKDWTNWSDYYQTDMKAHEGTEDYELKTTDYLQNLLQAGEKSSTDTTKSSHEIDEYPYVMTGGTYTWTGLKAFYDNMVKNDDSQTAKDIANDARDKYLIIFTDGRDNTQDYSVSEATDDTPAGSPKYTTSGTFGGTKYVGTYNPYAGEEHKVGFSFEYYNKEDPDNKVPKFNKGVRDIETDGDLAEAWADKLKDEGYTIYCVMMASGSISRTANADEYNKAKNFLKSLSGSNELDAQIAQMQQDIEDEIKVGLKPDDAANQQQEIEALRDDYVIVVDPTETGGMTVTDAFQQILEDIQLPRNDYTVQDYIDPRFDLVDKDGNLYKLGAGGKITVSNRTTKTVGNVIDALDETPNMTAAQCQALGLAYTPQESHMVNRTSSTDMKGDVGTGYIYYDDVKDMYYLRWTDQIIPMENEAFDTDKDHRNLDVWSATIRLKAKDDFIGGNNILTNGNEAGENLVYSDATIENMGKGENWKLYGLTSKDATYRQKLAVLSGTDRKINAVDAGGVSQAVYGNGIDIPSSGFPRTTVNVRLLPLNANNLNDVIYMGEVVSPTMMLADLENGYMTGSYYLQYLERYAYRVYGEDADSMPLIELLNKWLKINEEEVEAKTFTIPYIYLPDPEYGEDGKLARDTATNKVNIQNSTGASWKEKDIDFADLNLRDVTGFITYTWKREDEDTNKNGTIEKDERESQQYEGERYDITKDYVAKNTKQIKYNLQLTFTPLKEGDLSTDFKLGENFINEDKFFTINENGEFIDSTTKAWTIDTNVNSNRADYLQAMIQEKRTYEPHVMYNESEGKWVLVDEDSTTDFKPDDAITAYTKDGQTEDAGDGKVTDSGVYDWTPDYKPASGKVQLEGDLNTYTETPENVNFADAKGNKIEGTTATAPVSLAANTTYTKDVVNAALALELVVDGKYLKPGSEINPNNGTEKTFTFKALREYNDPLDPLPYGGYVNADVYTDPTGHNGYGRNYKLTFTVDTASIPKDPQDNQPYTVWAKLTKVEVEQCGVGGVTTDNYTLITESATTDNPYLGYEKPDALPIGTYTITTARNSLENDQFKIADSSVTGTGADLNFKYLNVDSDTLSYKHDRFPESVYEESDTAVTSTGDGDYQIWNKSKDNSSKNIAESKSERQGPIGMLSQTVTFYFGTVDVDRFTENNKGESVKDNPETTNDYAKDRLGIIMLSVDPNSLTITKEVDNTERIEDINREWDFTVTIKTSDHEWLENNHLIPLGGTLNYTLYERETSGNWGTGTVQQATVDEPSGEMVDGNYINTLTIHLTLKHDQKAVFRDLPSGTWQVEEVKKTDVLYTPHNNQSGFGEDEWRYQNSAATNVNTLNPISQVDYVNEFPYELPSTGGSGTVRYLLIGTAIISVGAMLFAVLFFDRRKKARK